MYAFLWSVHVLLFMVGLLLALVRLGGVMRAAE